VGDKKNGEIFVDGSLCNESLNCGFERMYTFYISGIQKYLICTNYMYMHFNMVIYRDSALWTP